jgi:hypothetical protein
MAIDFNVLNQQGALPDFISRLQQPPQQQESSGGLTAAQAAQLNMAYVQDQRQAKMDEVKLAREKQAMGLDVNADNRAGLMNSAQIERLGNQTAIDWAKFVKDSDIADKNYELAKDKQKTDKEFRREELDFNKKLETDKFGLQSKMTDKQIEWGDRGADREDQKFQFDIKKWDYKNQKDQEFADTLKKAREQGAEAYSNALLDKGLVQEANVFQDISMKLRAGQEAQLTKEQEKAKQAAFVTLAPTILQGKEPPLTQSVNFIRTVYGPEIAATVNKDNVKDVMNTAFLSTFGPQLEGLSKSGEAANLVAAQNGFAPLKTKMTTGQMDERSKQATNNYIESKSIEQLESTLESMAALGEKSWTIGTGPTLLQSGVNDVLSTAQAAGNAIGLNTGTGAIEEDARNEAFQTLKAQASSMLSASLRGGDEVASARVMSQFNDALDGGPDAIKEFMNNYNFGEKKTRAKVIGVMLDAFPDKSYDQIQRIAEPYIRELAQIRKEVKQKTGRDLTPEEESEYLNSEVKL